MVSGMTNAFFHDSRGNVVAMVVIAAAVLVTAAVLLSQAAVLAPPTVPISTALSETEISAKKAISIGLSKWAESGFSFFDPRWYNNGNFPPSFDEAKESQHKYTEGEVTLFLDELSSARGYKFEGTPVITFDTDAKATLDSLDETNKKTITIRISGISVVDEKPGATAKQEINEEFKFDYPFWGLYEKMYQWSSADMGGTLKDGNTFDGLSLALERIMDSKPYQLRGCDCGYITSAVSQEKLKAGKITWEEFEEQAVKPAVEALQAKFGPEVTCAYTVEEKDVENIPNNIQVASAGCSCQGGVAPDSGLTFEKEPKPTAVWVTNKAGGFDPFRGIKWKNGEYRIDLFVGRGPALQDDYVSVGDTVLTPQSYDCSGLDDTTIIATSGGVGYTGQDLCNGEYICAGTTCSAGDKTLPGDDGKEYALQYAAHETIGWTKRAAAIVIVECKDDTRKVQTEGAFKDLTAKLKVRFSIIKGAAPPGQCPAEAGDSCVFIIVGGNASSGGSQCDAVDNLCNANIAGCSICKCMEGSTLKQMPAGSTQEQCAAAGGTLQCKPAISGERYCPDIPDEVDPDCILWKCEMVDGTDSQKKATNVCDLGAGFRPTSCSDCKTCDASTGKCTVPGGQAGKTCDPNPPSVGDKTAGEGGFMSKKYANPMACYGCTAEGNCELRPNAETYPCYNHYGCMTYCAADGTCSVPGSILVGAPCPVTPDYECTRCVISNSILVCAGETATCGKVNNCCSAGSGATKWGRCIGANGLCCPSTRSLTACPTPT